MSAAPWETPPPGSQPQQTDAPKPWETPAPQFTAPDPADVREHLQNSPGMKTVSNPLEALEAGFQMSATGLLMHKPNMALPQNASFWTKLTYALSESGGDLPWSVAGAFGGASIAAGATAEASPIAQAGAGMIGARAGAGAAPETIRQLMMDYYDKGTVHSWQDFFHMFSHNAWEIGKAATVNIIAGRAGDVAGDVAGNVTANAFARTAANVTGYTTAATGMQSVLDGHMPNASDFGIAAVNAIGLHTAGTMVGARFQANDTGNRVISNMQSIYRDTGIPPWEQADMAKRDAKFRDELLAQDVADNSTHPDFYNNRPAEPEPFRTNALKVQDEHEGEVSDVTSAAFLGHAVEQILPRVRALEDSADDAISPAGAIGRYQIMPGTARQYGFDPSRLTDPVYNEAATRTILADLYRRFHGDEKAVLVAYNAGPGRALEYQRRGDDASFLPRETQNYLAHSERLGATGEGGEGGLPPKPPVERSTQEPPEGSDGEPDFTKLNTESRLSRFQDAIGEEPTLSGKTWSDFMRQWISELEPARQVDKEMIRRGLLDPTRDLGTEDMFRQTYRSDDRAAHFFYRGPLDPVTFDEKEGPSLQDVIKAVHDTGGNLDEFNLYRVAQRTVEKARQGIDTGVFPGGLREAQANAFDPNLKKYAAANAMMQEWKSSVLEYVRDSGGISQAQMDAMEKANTSHVSLRRIMGDNAPFAVPKGAGKNFLARSPLHRMEGSDRQIIDPMIADIDNATMMIRFADRNRAASHVVEAGAGEKPLPEGFTLATWMNMMGLKRIGFIKPSEATLAEPGSNIFKPYTMNENEAKGFEPFAQLATKGGLGANQFLRYVNGRAELWEAKDPDLAKLIRGADSVPEADIVSRVLQFPAVLQRAGIADAPDFALRVPLRHQLTAFTLDPLHPPPYLTMLRGIFQSFGHGDEFWELARKGGLNTSIIELDRNYIRTNAQKLLDESGFNDRAWNTVKHPLQLAQLLTERISNASNIGYYKRAKAMGIDDIKAATMASKAFLDYKERATGTVANMMAKWVPFFRPAMLGLKQGYEAVSEHPFKTAAAVGLGLIVPQMLLYALNRAADPGLDPRDRYTSLPNWERDLYFITPPIMGQRYRLAKPFFVGPLVGVPVERAMERIFENNPHAFDGMLGEIMSDVTPGIIPAFAKPIIEQMANYDFFKGQPLISDRLKDATADAQYTEYTSEPAKAISKVLGTHQGIGAAEVSPIVLDNYVNEWSGPVGMAVLHAVGQAMPHEFNRPFEISNLPFVGSFMVRHPGMDAAQINSFYDEAKTFEALHQDKVLEVKRGQIGMAIQDALGAKTNAIIKIERALSIQRAAIEAIDRNKKMTTDDKRQLTDRIVNDAIATAQFGTKVLHGQVPPFQDEQVLAQGITADVKQAEQQ